MNGSEIASRSNKNSEEAALSKTSLSVMSLFLQNQCLSPKEDSPYLLVRPVDS